MSKVHSSLGVNVLRPVNLGWQYQIPTDSLRDDEVIHVDSPNTDLVLIIVSFVIHMLNNWKLLELRTETGKENFTLRLK